MNGRATGIRRASTIALWAGVALLALLGVIASVGRAFSVLEGLTAEGPPPELSSLDRGSMIFMAALIGFEPESELYREVEIQNRRFLGKFYRFPATTLLHVLPAILFLLLAPLQFSRSIRSRHPRWHRWSGRVIVATAIPVGLSGLFFGLVMPFSGALEASAIALFGGLFFVAAIRGFLAIRRRDIVHHREWMIRLFAVALGVSTVRLAGTVLAVLTLEGPEAWFGHSVWIGFGLTVAFAEWWIRRTRTNVSQLAGAFFVPEPEVRR